MNDENLEQNVSEEQENSEQVSSNEEIQDNGKTEGNYDNNGQPWPMSFTKYDDYLQSENKNKKSKIGLVHIIVFVFVIIALFALFFFLGLKPMLDKIKQSEDNPSSKVSYGSSLYVVTGKFIDQWNPIDWYTLERNPLSYKSFGDEILDEIYLYSDYISGKDKLGFKSDQLFWDVNYTLIRKVFLGSVSEIDIKKSVEREINRFFKELDVKDFKSDVSDCNIEKGFLKSVISKYEPKIQEVFDKKKTSAKKIVSFDELENIFSYAVMTGLYFGLNDPYSTLMTNSEYSDMMSNLNEDTFGGIGVYIEKSQASDSQLTIVEPVDGTPAFRAGLLPGDVIYEIDGMKTQGVDIMVSVSKMRGPKGSDVKLKILRDHKYFDVTIRRDDIKITSVSHKIIKSDKGNFGYIRVRSFASETAEEFDTAVAEIKKPSNNIKGLIVDVRNNGGGYLVAGLELSSRFAEKGKVIHKEVDHDDKILSCYSLNRPKVNMPSVLLVNRLSASSSEIFAGALKDNNSAILIGERTFGKGSVQQVFEQDNGCAVKLTIAHFLSPNGSIIHKRGIKPDINIEMKPRLVGKKDDIQLQKAIDELSSKF